MDTCEEPPLGAHLVTPRKGYTHHGIYVGDGRVVHYAGSSRWLRRGPVEEVSLERFARGRGYRVQPAPCPRFDAEAVVRRARARLGENAYRLLSNNCEHFCAWCLYGQPRSSQVEQWLVRPAAVLRGVTGRVSSVLRRPAYAA
jgi:hypothetical protein